MGAGGWWGVTIRQNESKQWPKSQQAGGTPWATQETQQSNKTAPRRSAGVSPSERSDVPRLQVGNREGSLGTKGAFYPRSVAARARLSPPSTLPSPYL